MNPEPVILAYTRDMMLTLRIEQVARLLGVRVLIISQVAQLLPALRHGPRLMLVDAGAPDSSDVKQAITLARQWTRDMPIVGFVPHVNESAREQVLAAGATEVWTRGRLLKNLPHLVSRNTAPPPSLPGCSDPPPPLLLEGLRLFNQGAYYRCHDALEEAWRAEDRPCRLLYQGILQLAIALHHIQKQNWQGADKMFARATGKLQRLPDTCQGIDVAYLRSQCHDLWQLLAELRAGERRHFPSECFPCISVESGS